ncbi:MAG TPA: GNAT family N-acetyltransferase [Vicinamibacterales bacterium]|nr:GNAT family N-acetyltransferase [Vicinamibacterales bacterium]
MTAAARVHLISPNTLSSDLIDVWQSHRATDENLRGPFFSPEYVRIAASARPEVTIAVIETPGQAPAFLPLHRDASIARPVGLRASDFSGIIAAPGYEWSPESVLRSCGLSGWDFTNIVVSDPTMRPHFRAFADSPFADLSEGFEAFCKERSQSGSDLVKSVAQKARKMEREVAPMRFEAHVVDRQALALLYEWKAAQRARTGTVDVLSTPWMRAMVERMLATSTDAFGGLLSVLYAGDQVAAVHFGMRSETVWHYWFAAYNHELQRYSPGLIILLEMLKAAPELGIRTLTLGQGDEAYKLRYATGSTQLASGSVDCRLTRRLTNAVWYAARTASHHSSVVAALVRSVKRGRRRMFQGAQ